MKLNKEKFMKTEMGGELEETIRTWDKACLLYTSPSPRDS